MADASQLFLQWSNACVTNESIQYLGFEGVSKTDMFHDSHCPIFGGELTAGGSRTSSAEYIHTPMNSLTDLSKTGYPNTTQDRYLNIHEKRENRDV